MKNILVIGGNSKLAKIFIKNYKHNANLLITYRGKNDATIVDEDGLKTYELNMGDIFSVLLSFAISAMSLTFLVMV